MDGDPGREGRQGRGAGGGAGLIERAKQWARHLKRDVVAIYFAARDPRMPWGVRILALAVAAYALSPIDLIPDFIPVIGYLDDLLIVPLGLWLVLKLTPPHILEDARTRARQILERPRSRIAAAIFIAIWIVCAALLAWWTWTYFPQWFGKTTA